MPTVIPAITLGTVLKFIGRVHMRDQIGEFTWGMYVTALVGAAPTLQQVADYVQVSLIEASMPPAFANSATIRALQVDQLSLTTGFILVSATSQSNAVVGTGGAVAAPSQSAPVIQKVTGLAGPAHRGRCYSPFPPTAGLTATGELTVGFRNALTSIYGAVMGPWTLALGANSLSTSPCLIHKGSPVTFDDIIDIRANGLVGTQKRRGDYGRSNP